MTGQRPTPALPDRAKAHRAYGAHFVPLNDDSGHAAIPLLADPDTDRPNYYQGPPEHRRSLRPAAGR